MQIIPNPQMSDIVEFEPTRDLAGVSKARFYDHLIALVLNPLRSVHSKRAYKRAIECFLAWYELREERELTKSVLIAYIDHLRKKEYGPATINLHVAAVRSLVKEAADDGLVDLSMAAAILRVKGEKKEGRITGTRISERQAETLINAPNTSTLKGLRDRAIFAVEIGCWLRRNEACSELRFDHIQQIDGRWVIVDIKGKREKIRSVPMPAFAKAAVDAWASAAGISSGYVFRSVDRWGHVSETPTPPQTLYEICKLYGPKAGVKIEPHDLRRSGARISYDNGADLKQIQLALGHESIKTTEGYLGVELDFSRAACDKINIKLNTI